VRMSVQNGSGPVKPFYVYNEHLVFDKKCTNLKFGKVKEFSICNSSKALYFESWLKYVCI
jgi:hypothetical protein